MAAIADAGKTQNVERRLEISEDFFANGLPEAFKGAKRPRSEGNEQKIPNGLISPSREAFCVFTNDGSHKRVRMWLPQKKGALALANCPLCVKL